MNKILVVDDQDAVRKLLKLTLSGQYELFEAREASEAWKLMSLVRPDVLILDIMMPGDMDGYQLCRKIRGESFYQDLHIIMVTARGQESDQKKGLDAGADAYFVKPFSPLELARHIERAIPHVRG